MSKDADSGEDRDDPGHAQAGTIGLPGKTIINLKQIQAFRAVMVTGTTLDAGLLLHTSQPAISRLVAGLESVAGYKLFERKHGRLLTTRHAKTLLEEVEKTFAGLDKIASLLRSEEGASEAHLRIVATAPMAYGLLSSALKVLHVEYPEVTVEVKAVVRRELRSHIDAQQFDVALATYPLDYPDSASEMLTSADAVCVVPQGHLLASRSQIQPADLVDEHFISMPLETGARQKTDMIFQQMGYPRRLMSEGQNGTMICQMVASGLGVSVIDPFSALALDAGIVRIPFKPSIPYHFRVFFPLQRPRSPLALAFARIGREAAGQLLRENYAVLA